MSISINMISYSFTKGGAAIAAKKFSVIAQHQLNYFVTEHSIKQGFNIDFLKRVTSYFLAKLQRDKNPIKHSLNLFSSRDVIQLFKRDSTALFHLHWINNDVISIFDLDKIASGGIITLHDEWFYCGAEHCYKVFDTNLDFIDGYHLFKKDLFGLNWNYLIWKVKLKKLASRRDLIFTVPSKWMLERAQQSMILKTCDIRLLPNPIDTNTFIKKSVEQCIGFREKYGLKSDDVLLCFGAVDTKSYYKGSQFIIDALSQLRGLNEAATIDKIKLVVFGGDSRRVDYGFEAINLGYIDPPDELALVYSSVDCVLVPSMVESFGQVAAEAAACESAVICFECSGLKDIVIDGETGFTAHAFSSTDLVEKIKHFLNLPKGERAIIGAKARKHIQDNFSFESVASKYSKILTDAARLKNDKTF